MLSMKTNIPQITNRLKRIKLLVDGGWQDDVRKMMVTGHKNVKKLTPISKGARKKGKKHFRTGWLLRIIGGKKKSRIPMLGIIYHDGTHKFTASEAGVPRVETKAEAFLLVNGTKQKYTLLDILEYGSKPHSITPTKENGVLTFKVGSQQIFTRHVSHPGTQPYAMVRKTRVLMVHMFNNIIRTFNKKLADAWR